MTNHQKLKKEKNQFHSLHSENIDTIYFHSKGIVKFCMINENDRKKVEK
jgi:hypothetical protein